MSKPFSFFSTPSSTPGTTSGGLFGSTSSTTASTQPSTGGLFSFGSTTGASTQPSTTTTGFGSTGFGLNKPATTTSSPFGSLASSTTQPTTSGFGGFGKPATTTGSTSLFGQTTPSTSTTTTATAQPSTGFGSFGSFGSTTTSQPSTGFGLGTSTTPSTGLFGSTQTKPTGSIFGQTNITTLSLSTALAQPQQTQPAQQAQTEQDALLLSLVNPQVFNDERDAILSKWNQLQAFYGFGKMFYQNSSMDVTKENQLSRFKTVGYCCKPTYKNEDGLVCLIFNKKESDVRSNQKAIQDGLLKIFNSDPSLTIVIESIKENSDDKTELQFYVKQKVSQLSDQTNRVASLMVFNHLNKQEAPPSGLLGGLKTTQTIKQQLEQLGVVNMYPLTGLSDEQIKSLLDTPPTGLNPVLWEQAKKNNPNPKKLIPVSINGFQEIHKRFKQQEQENNFHKNSLTSISDSIEFLNSRNKLLKSKIDQFKARNEDLEQRVLKLMINYEIRRKIGLPLQENEKYLLSILDSFQMELNSPINKEIQRQKLNEFVEIIKAFELNRSQNPLQTTTSNLTDMNNLNELQKSLRDQHKAFKSLIDIVNKDLNDLEKIRKGLGIEK